MNAYKELRARHQAEVNAFPMHFAFGQEQLEAKLKELGLTEKNYRKHIVGIGAGGFILKKDKAAFEEMFRRHAKERADAMSPDTDGTGYLYDMFRTELLNHEYGYTLSVSETLDALGLTEKDFVEKPTLKKALEKAASDIRGEEGFGW